MSNEATQDESWKQAVPRTQDALAFLGTTAEDVATSRTIESDVRAEAIAIARQLAAELTGFGFAEAAEHAQDVVAILDRAGLPQPERLQQQVATLQTSLAPALEE